MSRFRGVHPHKDGGWTASIGVAGKKLYLGIHFDYQRYRDLREEGYSDYQARVMAGFADPDEAKE